MKINNKQKGAGIIKMLLSIVIFGLSGIYGVQVGIAYLDKQIIEKAAKNILLEAKNNDKVSIKEIRESIVKKIEVNNIELSADDVVITKDGNDFVVKVDYSKEIGINKNMKFVMNFAVEESTP